MSKKVVIIGGSISGVCTANRLRRLSEDVEINIITKGDSNLYSKMGMTSIINDEVISKEDLLLETEDELIKKYNIGVNSKCEVLRIDERNKKLYIKDLLKMKEFEETYDYLVLAPGNVMEVPKLNGIDSPWVFKAEKLQDGIKIKEYLDNNKPKKAVVVGASYSGLEIAEALMLCGIHVTVVEKENHILPDYDRDISKIISNHLAAQGIRVILGNELKEIKDNVVKLKHSGELEAELVIFATGVRPNTEWLNNTFIELDENKCVKVNKYLKTSNDDVFAVGGAISIADVIKNKYVNTKYLNSAIVQARIVAGNIIKSINKKTLLTYEGNTNASVSKIFELCLGRTGKSKEYLEENGVTCFDSIIISQNHPDYIDNSEQIIIKLIFDKKGKVLGSQVVGRSGIDKCVDIISTVMYFGGSVYDMARLELTNTPSFGPIISSINSSGRAASNLLDGKIETVKSDELLDILDKDNSNILLLDVRDKDEVKEGYIDGSVNIPLEKLRFELANLNKSKETIIYCETGSNAYMAVRLLKDNGFKKVKYLQGGYNLFKEYNKVLAFKTEDSKVKV